VLEPASAGAALVIGALIANNVVARQAVKRSHLRNEKGNIRESFHQRSTPAAIRDIRTWPAARRRKRPTFPEGSSRGY
jgi:hypothetical protein